MDAFFFINIVALLFSFFVIGLVLGVAFSRPIRKQVITLFRLERFAFFAQILALDKSVANPIMRPGSHPWTAEAVLNPAALVLHNRTHLVYRAIGLDGVSRLGYASSANGIIVDERFPYPIYIARSPRSTPLDRRFYSPMLYPSGGSWGGCEDPRMVEIDGTVYITFNMFDHWTLRVAVAMLSVDDFIKKRFYRLDGPYVLSHGARDKNWVLFPEKIGGQFAVLHSIIGEDDDHVRIEYTDDLTTLSLRHFESPDPQRVPDRQIAWHVHVRSAGPPPIRTEQGWLVLYHANDAEAHKYKVGAMLLDLVDPTKILHRSVAPVLTPHERYENDGKPGIVYVCGAVVRSGVLYVYYGGADKVVCVATTELAPFVDAIIAGNQPVLQQEAETQTT